MRQLAPSCPPSEDTEMGRSAGAGQDLQPLELWEGDHPDCWGWPWEVEPGKSGPLAPEGSYTNQLLHNSSLFSHHLELRREGDLHPVLTMFLPCFIVLIVYMRGTQSARLHFWQPQTPNVYISYLQAACGIPGWATCLLLPLIYCLLHLRIGTHHPAASHKWNSAGVGLDGHQGTEWNVVKIRSELVETQQWSPRSPLHMCPLYVPLLKLCPLLRIAFLFSLSFCPPKLSSDPTYKYITCSDGEHRASRP